VRRGLRLLRTLRLPPLVAALRACLPDAPGSRGGGAPPRASLPCAAFGEHAARRLLCTARLCASLRAPLSRAAAECSALLAQSYFMPLALTALALCGRTAALLRAMQADAARAYNALAPLLAALPPPCGAPPPHAPRLPALLRCDWGAGPAPDALTLVGELPPHVSAPPPPLALCTRSSAAPPASLQPHGDDVGAAVARGAEERDAPAPEWVPLCGDDDDGDGDAAPMPPARRAPVAVPRQQALVFMDRGGGEAVAIADEADEGAAAVLGAAAPLLVSAERPRYALLTPLTVEPGMMASAGHKKRQRQQGGEERHKRGGGGRGVHGRGGAPGNGGRGGRGHGGGGGGGSGGDALSMLLGGTGMDWR
jgi:uncharacterized membrane protein YgcG